LNQMKGIPASPGIALGPVFHYRPIKLEVEKISINNPEAEWSRLERALVKAEDQLQNVYEKALLETGAASAEIFQAQLEMLRDPELLMFCRRELDEHLVNIEAAWQEATEHYARMLEGMQNEYFQARAADVRDMASRVLRVLAGTENQASAGLSRPSILLAYDLTPSDTILLDKSFILGFCTSVGGETSHTAILARSLGLPAIVGAGPELMTVPTDSRMVLDGYGGMMTIDPDSTVETYWVQEKKSREELYARATLLCHDPAVTTDGKQVEVVANIGSLDSARKALEHGAEGVGLLRTEFLFLERDTLPDEEEQVRVYTEILDVFGKLPVVLRTIDIGGDKEIAYLNLAKETNPFLGVRGLRLCLARPDLFKPQLRAAFRASRGHNLKLMFPMVATLGEVQTARSMVNACLAELAEEGRPLLERVEIGIMVEIPSAALLAEHIAPAVDFFSIGTNDLTQYTLAVDRSNANLSYLTSAFSPAVLALIGQVIQAGHHHGKWVGVCGELAGEPLAIPILLGLGLDEFSMNPPAVPLAKQIIRRLNLADCQTLARSALTLENPQQVKDLVNQHLPWIRF
jgi:phosphoenolpyruvate-protein phosphotransferase